jgi:hypothetical protein
MGDAAVSVGHHMKDMLRIAALPRDQWKGEIAKLSDDAQKEVSPWLRMQYRIQVNKEKGKDMDARMDAHNKTVQETKRRKRK